MKPSIEKSGMMAWTNWIEPSIEWYGVEMIPVQVRITKKIIEEIDLLVQRGIYSNRSEVIRDATRRHVMGMNEKR
jgi:hypothetical protein